MRSSVQWVLALSFLVPLGAVSRSAHGAVPVDVDRLNQAGTLIEQAGQRTTVDEATYTSAFSDIAMSQVLILADENRLPQGARLASSAFREMLRGRVSKVVRPAAGAPPSKRASALYDALATIANRRFAEQVLAEWLSTPETGALGKAAVAAIDDAEKAKREEAERKNPPEEYAKARQQAVAAAQADPKVRQQRMSERFRRQFTAGEVRGSLRVVAEEVQLVSDAGGAGSDNGVIDAGEWVTFQIPVANVGDRPFFSASAWVRAEHECAWSGVSREIVLDEMADGGKTSIPVRAYFSDACPDRTRVAFTIEVRDTVRASEAGIVLPVYLAVTNVGRGALVDSRFDRDEPGTSDGKMNRQIEPDMNAELSAGFELTKAGAERVLQNWGVSKDVEDLASQASYRMGETMLRDASGAPRYAPYDDLDLRIREKDAYASAIRGVSSREGWSVPDDAGGVAVVETVVDFPGLEGSWAPEVQVALPEKPAEPPKPPAIPSASAALAAIKPYVRVEAREVKPADDAVAAVSSEVFDATIDEEAFKLAWCRLTTVQVAGAPDPCDPKACPPVAVVVKPAPEVDLPPFREPARYTFRNLVWMPASWTPSARAERVPEPEPIEEPATPETVQPKVVKDKPTAPRFMAALTVDVGKTSLTSQSDSLGFAFLGDAVTAPTLGMDLSYGGKLRGHVGLGLPVALGAALPTLAVPSLAAGGLQAYGGVGYLFPLSAPIDLETNVRLGLSRVVTEGIAGPPAGIVIDSDRYFEIGETVHWRVAKPASVFVGLSYRNVFDDSVAGLLSFGSLYDTSGVRFQVGGAFRY